MIYSLRGEKMNKCLYQIIEKQHMEFNAKEEIDADEWDKFCLKYIDAFADEVSLLALEYWNQRTWEEEE